MAASRLDYGGDADQDLVAVRKSDGALMFYEGKGDAVLVEIEGMIGSWPVFGYTRDAWERLQLA